MPDAPEHWARVKEVLNLALDADPGERTEVIRKVCRGDAALVSDVESLLSYTKQTGHLDRCLHQSVAELAGSGEAPQRIGPYRVERLLGRGGMGSVYLGVRDDDALPARVALKIIQAGTSEALIERFGRERRILAGLIHPYIARLLDAGKLDDGRPYFVMEYVEGETIADYAAQHPDAVLDLFLKVCSAVQFAHQNLVIHRDLKPGNILVTAGGEPRLLDFGIAKLLAVDDTDGAKELTQPLDRLLTPSAASPEQAAGEAVTIASDVYSLGVLLYRLLTGVSPYAAAPDFAANPTRVIREYEPPPASTTAGLSRRARAALQGDIDNILRKALEKDPRNRYFTVQQFAGDIERHRRGLPIEARPASFRYRAAKFIRRNRLAVTAAALLVLAIAGGLVATTLYARRAHQEQLRAQRELAALRKLMQSFLFEFDDAIKNLPGSSEARGLVIRRAVEYLDKVSSEAGDDAPLLSDLAEAYTHVANLTGAFREARGDTAPLRGVENALKASAIWRRLAALNPHDETIQDKFAASVWTTASRYSALGDLAHAGSLFAEYLRLAKDAERRTGAIEARYHLGTAYTSLGFVERETGHLDASLEHQRSGLSVREGLLKADPSSTPARRVVGISHEFIGYTLAFQQKHLEAAEEHRQALAMFEPLAKANPRNLDLQRLTAVSAENLCESLARGGRPADAVVHCEKAVQIHSAIMAADPKDVQAFEDLADCESTLSIALDLAHSLPDAMAHQQRARQLFSAAMSRDSDSFDLEQENAVSLMELAKLRNQLHLPGGPDAAAGALNGLQALAKRSPENQEIEMYRKQAEVLVQSLSGRSTGQAPHQP